MRDPSSLINVSPYDLVGVTHLNSASPFPSSDLTEYERAGVPLTSTLSVSRINLLRVFDSK